jgi:hypothetical protein
VPPEDRFADDGRLGKMAINQGYPSLSEHSVPPTSSVQRRRRSARPTDYCPNSFNRNAL